MSGAPDSYVRANVARMAGYVPGEQPSAPGVIKLNTNENPYPPSPRVADALEGVTVESMRRYPDPMALKLRAAIANLHGCSVGQVFAGNGSDEVLALCLRAFVEQDGSVGYFDPSYSLYPVLADIQGIRKKPVKLGDGFAWSISSDFTASLFFLTNPNAPTSILYSRRDVEEFCERFDGVVVIDEAYVDFSSRDCMDLALTRDNVLVARTLSKSYSLAGIRMGYLVGDPRLIAALYKIKDSYNLNLFTQAVAVAAIGDLEYMRANCVRIIATRARIAAGLQDMAFDVFPSETNFLWVRPHAAEARSLFAALRAKSIYVRHFPGERTGDYLRITIGTNEEMDCFMDVLRSILR